MKNKLFWGLAVSVLVLLALIVWGAFAGVKESFGLTDPVGAVCTLGFLVVAFVAWEFLMKPGYGRIHRETERDRGAEEDASEEGLSPRAP